MGSKKHELPDGKIPKFIKSLKLLCTAYCRNWPGLRIVVRPEYVKAWQQGKKLEQYKKWNTNIEPHPVINEDACYNWKECRTWFEKTILPRYENKPPINGIANDTSEPEVDFHEDEKRKQFAHNEWKRQQERNEFVHRSVALATGIAAVKKVHLMVRAEDERELTVKRRDKLAEILKAEKVQAELTDKICAEFMTWDIELGKAITDRRETAMEEAAKLEIK